ncbi:MAG TPA: hypothetical protein VGC89_06785 [Pyrinomonadaceae bacterium]|jgi:hypothetical protein
MTPAEEKAIRSIVRSEILEIITDAQESVGLKKDPTGMGRKALEGLANLIRSRESEAATGGD